MPPANLALIAVTLLAAALARAAGAPAAPPPPAGLPHLEAGTSLLVVAPHPDDETLCCAGVIQGVLSAGGRVSVVWITSGDGSELGSLLVEKSLIVKPAKMREFAVTRMREARAAAALLGVPQSGQLFLGYPDGGLLQLVSGNLDKPYTSRFTQAAAVPYPEALFPGHPYTGASLQRDFAAVLERVQPTFILAPSPLDSHADHRAAGLLAISTSQRRGTVDTVRFWIVHGGEGWPSPRGLVPGIPLTPAPLGRGLGWGTYRLGPAQEDRKLAAVRAYDTQLRVMEPFLLSFVRTTELFSPGPPSGSALP